MKLTGYISDEDHFKVKKQLAEAIGCIRSIRDLKSTCKNQPHGERIAGLFLADRGIK